MYDYFDTALSFVIGNEGGLVNNPNDPGGITNKGICLRTLRGHGLKYDWNKDGQVNEWEIEHLTDAQAAEYYKNEYWNDKYNLIDSQNIVLYIFDMAVNMGPSTAHKLVQRSLNCQFGSKSMFTVDGVLGDKTISGINHAGLNMMPVLRAQREGEYLLIVKEDPALASDLDGFMNRVFKL